MTLPINSANRPAPLDATAARPGPGVAQASSKPVRLTPATDAVALSGTSAAVRDLAVSPPVDAGKVASLKAAIAAGTYTVDAGKLADKMIALDLP